MVWGVKSNGTRPFADPSVYAPFLTDLPSTQRLTVRAGERLPAKGGAPLFESGTTWTLYEIPSGYLMTLPSAESGRPTQCWIQLSKDFQTAEVFSEDDSLPALPYPFDQLWAMHLLAGREGLLCHGCGVSYQGQGLLFLGHSGAGKTTMARLWASVPGATILSDERVIVRKTNAGYRLYGTPWHGEGHFADPGVVPLQRIFILSHGLANRINPLTGSGAVAAVLARSLAPYWHQALMDDSLRMAAALCQALQIEGLEFVPDHGVIDLVQGPA
jgi:hypothetical protein